jgi:hypothetical protein
VCCVPLFGSTADGGHDLEPARYLLFGIPSETRGGMSPILPVGRLRCV